MGWKIINNREYYYQNIKTGGRVRSIYVGRGDLARFLARKDREARQGRRAAAEAARAAREAVEAEDRALDDWFFRVEGLADAALVAAGYRKHHRSQWRKKRHAP